MSDVIERYFELKKKDLEKFIDELCKQPSLTPAQIQELLSRLKRLREVASEIEHKANQEVHSDSRRIASVRFYFMVQTVLGDDEGTMFDEDWLSTGGELMKETLGSLNDILKNINIEMKKPVEKRVKWTSELRGIPNPNKSIIFPE